MAPHTRVRGAKIKGRRAHAFLHVMYMLQHFIFAKLTGRCLCQAMQFNCVYTNDYNWHENVQNKINGTMKQGCNCVTIAVTLIHDYKQN